MLNSLCFTPETCEVIHNCAGIIKLLCWYKTAEGEKQSRNFTSRDVWWGRKTLQEKGVGPGAARAEGSKGDSTLANSAFPLFLPLPLSTLAGRGASLVIAKKHLQLNNPVSKRVIPLLWWEGEEMPGLCCVPVGQWDPKCLKGLLMSCRRTNVVCFAALLSLCPAGAAVFLLSFISSLQGAWNELIKCSQYLKQGTLQPCLKCSLG